MLPTSLKVNKTNCLDKYNEYLVINRNLDEINEYINNNKRYKAQIEILESIKKIGYNKYRNSYVNIIFQSYNLIPYMTAYENVEVALDIARIKLSKEEKKEKILSTLNELGIDNSAAFRTVLKLSGGEQQRVAIARCLVTDIPFIMADEPTGNLDEDTEKKIIDIFKKLAKQGKGVIVVTHSKELAESSDKIYHIKGGGVY